MRKFLLLFFFFPLHGYSQHLIWRAICPFTAYNQNGLFSLRLKIESLKDANRIPLYIHYDLHTKNFFTLKDMLKTKNDIFSFQQSVCSTMTDSIRIFEQNNLNQLLEKGVIDQEKYGKIIERLNANLSFFKENYFSDFIFTEKGIEEDFDCILPDALLPYHHTYRMLFPYKSMKYMVKEEYMNRLTQSLGKSWK